MNTNQKTEKFPHALIALLIALAVVLSVAPEVKAVMHVFHTITAALNSAGDTSSTR